MFWEEMKVITLAITKGGTGKSTCAVNLAVEFAADKKRTLLIDTNVKGGSLSFCSARQKNGISRVF